VKHWLLASLLLLPAFAQQTQPFVPPAAVDKIVSEQKAFLLDVRTPQEIRELGTLPGAVNIPVDELARRLDELPRDRLILTA
jgi:rhodanese-related sulfurtransferase